MSAFIRHTSERQVPLDFVSTHVYGNDTPKNVFGTRENIPQSEMVCRAAKKVHDEVLGSSRPDIPIIWSEYNSTYFNDPKITDSVFMGPWLADTLRRCDGLTDMMSYWTFSDVFEEQGVVRRPFYGGFGLIAAGNIPKPAFNAFKMLHELGEERYAADSEHALVTRRADGAFVIALWNYVSPGERGAPITIALQHDLIGLLPHSAMLIAMHVTRSKLGAARWLTRFCSDRIGVGVAIDHDPHSARASVVAASQTTRYLSVTEPSAHHHGRSPVHCASQ